MCTRRFSWKEVLRGPFWLARGVAAVQAYLAVFVVPVVMLAAPILSSRNVAQVYASEKGT